jgi:AcrR family transcriptional regulator
LWRNPQQIKEAAQVAKKVKSPEEVAAFRERVCVVATQLFADQGAGNVTMRQIAAKLGVSAMTPYRYFRDKDEILATVRAAAFLKFADTLEAALARGADALSKARAVGDAYVAFAHASPATYHLMFDFEQPDDGPYPELIAANARARRSMTAYVQEMINEGVFKGDAEEIGLMFWATIHGILMLDLAGALGRDVDPVALRTNTFRLFYEALAARSRA